MAFSNYKSISEVQKQFEIKYQEVNFIVAQDIEPPESFLKEFAFNREYIDIYTSEAARSEAIIFPMLREVYKHYHQQYSFWIQKAISYDHDLSGTPDYIVATKSALGKTVLESPLLIIVEAKKNDFEQGWGQCLAELVAAQKLNHDPNMLVHGIVTDGKLWEFGKLRADTFTKNIVSYTIDDVARLFGVLKFVFQAATDSAGRYVG